MLNCSISGDGVGSFNTANTLQDTPCSVEQDTVRKEVEDQVSELVFSCAKILNLGEL